MLLADGAWGTEFFKRGLMQGSPPDEWNLTHPEIVAEITSEYLEAGANIILTNSFGANRFRLEPHGLSGQVREINTAAAAIARRVVGTAAVVAGDIGPSARFLALGEVTAEELYEVFAEQARALGEAGVDWIVVESMTDMEEMAVAVRAAAETTHLPVVASMTYNRTPKGYRTMMGNSPEDCVQARRGVRRGADRRQLRVRDRRLCAPGPTPALPDFPAPLGQGECRHSADPGREGRLPAHRRTIRVLRAGAPRRRE